ncbi:unnamed protein product [Rhizophagus irregularis]|nr:unnamed protein product [Rhizophagus irregularis]
MTKFQNKREISRVLYPSSCKNLNDNDKSLSIADNENITSNPSETIKLPEKNSTDTALNLDSDFKNIDSTEEPPIPDSSSSASYQPTSVTPPTPAMTVTTKATTTSTTTTISRQPDKNLNMALYLTY